MRAARWSCRPCARARSAVRLSMPNDSVTHYTWEQMPKEQVSPTLDRRLITCEQLMIAHAYRKKGCVVPKQSHHNEQITYVLEGELKFWIVEDEGQVMHINAGEVLHIPRHVPHRRKPSRTHWMSTSSIHQARTGWARLIATCGNNTGRRSPVTTTVSSIEHVPIITQHPSEC